MNWKDRIEDYCVIIAIVSLVVLACIGLEISITEGIKRAQLECLETKEDNNESNK